MSSALSVSIAQRLVRTLCEACKKEIPLDGDSKAIVDKVLDRIVDKTYLDGVQREKMWASVGCPECSGLGYKGRIGVYEAVFVNDTIENAVISNPSERDIREAAKDQNILNLAEDGVIKVLSGQTTLEELDRVVDLSNVS